MDKLKELQRIILYTAYIEGEDAVSELIIGKPESGKSALTARVIGNKGIVELTDLSAWGICRMIVPMIERDMELKHIIIPDFLVVLSKNKATVERVMSFMSSLVEEGIVNIGTYLNKGIPFKVSDKVKNKKVKCGIITSMTECSYRKKRKAMSESGFLSRFLVVRYNYSDAYLEKRFTNIMYGNYLEKDEDTITLPLKKQKIIYNDKNIHKMLTDKARDKIEQGAVDGYGIRLSRMFMVMLKAIALKDGDKKVTMKHWLEFIEYTPLINYSGYNVATID